MDGPIEKPQQQRERDQQEEEEDDNESIDFVRIDQSEKDNSDQETSDQEEDHDQEHHHLVEGTDGGDEQQQEHNMTDWSFDGTMDSSAGGLSAAAAELVNLRMAALMAKNQVLEEQLKNAQLQVQIIENGVKFDALAEKNKTLESQVKNLELCEKIRKKMHEQKNAQLDAQIAETGVMKEKNKTLVSQLEKVELREKVLEKKLREKDKQVSQLTLNLATLGKQLATLSGNSTQIELHVCRGNQWDPATSSPIFAMNSVGTSFVLPAAILGGGETEDEVKWHHAFARKGFHVLDAIMKKGHRNNKATVFYYEVRIMAPQQLDSSDNRYHAIGLSMGYNTDYDGHVGQHPNSYGFDEFGQVYYVCGDKHRMVVNLPVQNEPISEFVIFDDTYGFGLLVKPDKKLAVFATINGKLIGQQVPIQFWSEFLYPTVSVSKLTTKVEANFGNDPTLPFRYDIANCPGLQLE